MNTKAIFTIVYGEKYVAQWNTCCKSSWEAYAKKHGYDIVLITEPIRLLHDLDSKPIHWQKLFVPSHPDAARYSDIVFLDSDIIINYHRAPCIVEANSSDRIGMVGFDRYVDDDLNYYLIFIRQAKFKNCRDRISRRTKTPGRMSLSGPDFSGEYSRYSARTDLPILNTGVMVMKPDLHRELLESVYMSSVDEVENSAEPGNYEQEYLAVKLIESDMVNLIDERFNMQAYFEMAIHYPFLFTDPSEEFVRMCMTTILSNCYFLHFAGNPELMPFATINEESDFAILGMQDPFKGDIENIRNRRRNTSSGAEKS